MTTLLIPKFMKSMIYHFNDNFMLNSNMTIFNVIELL